MDDLVHGFLRGFPIFSIFQVPVTFYRTPNKQTRLKLKYCWYCLTFHLLLFRLFSFNYIFRAHVFMIIYSLNLFEDINENLLLITWLTQVPRVLDYHMRSHFCAIDCTSLLPIVRCSDHNLRLPFHFYFMNENPVQTINGNPIFESQFSVKRWSYVIIVLENLLKSRCTLIYLEKI